MSETPLDVLVDAKKSVETLGLTAYLSRQKLPDPLSDVLVLIDLVATTGIQTYGIQQRTKRVQVVCYARTRSQALDMTDQIRAKLLAKGFTFLQQRSAPDPDAYGEISEYRR